MGLSLSVTKPRFASPHPYLHIDYHLPGKPHAHSTLGDFTHFSLISTQLFYFESLTLYLYVTRKIQFLLLRMHLQQLWN